jgi:hypothetical protein
MQSADAVTPAPTYGTSASSRSPCTVPSSPKGPCSTGKTTSTSRSVSGTRPVETGTSSAALEAPFRASSPWPARGSCHAPSRPISTVTVS